MHEKRKRKKIPNEEHPTRVKIWKRTKMMGIFQQSFSLSFFCISYFCGIGILIASISSLLFIHKHIALYIYMFPSPISFSLQSITFPSA